jgi:AraC-like DNA-binding protein
MNIIIHKSPFIDSIFHIPANLYRIEQDFSFQGSPSLNEHIIINQECANLFFTIEDRVFIFNTNMVCGKFTHPPKINIRFLDTDKKLTVIRLTSLGMFKLTNVPIASMVNSITTASHIGLDISDDLVSSESLSWLEKIIDQKPTQDSFNTVRNIINYINDHFSDLPTNVNQHITKKFGLSESTLQRYFKKYIGLNPSTYILTLKRKKMINSLANDRSDTLTVQENGYYDQSHFINDFRRLFGVSVKEYFSDMQEIKRRSPELFSIFHS